MPQAGDNKVTINQLAQIWWDAINVLWPHLEFRSQSSRGEVKKFPFLQVPYPPPKVFTLPKATWLNMVTCACCRNGLNVRVYISLHRSSRRKLWMLIFISPLTTRYERLVGDLISWDVAFGLRDILVWKLDSRSYISNLVHNQLPASSIWASKFLSHQTPVDLSKVEWRIFVGTRNLILGWWFNRSRAHSWKESK